jgi:hypothetical protein
VLVLVVGGSRVLVGRNVMSELGGCAILILRFIQITDPILYTIDDGISVFTLKQNIRHTYLREADNQQKIYVKKSATQLKILSVS